MTNHPSSCTITESIEEVHEMDFEEMNLVGQLELHELIQRRGQCMMDGLRVCFYDCLPLGTIAGALESALSQGGYDKDVFFSSGGTWLPVQNIQGIRGGFAELVYVRYYPKPGDNDVSFNV